jgi:antitoxin component YwqK of YwqJK toxin-antitoxin module
MKFILLLFVFLPILTFSQINQTDANGLRQGNWQKKQANGRLIYEGSFKDDKPVGEWKRYHPGGQVKAEITYKGDTAQTQLFDVWHKKVAEGNYVNQKKVGVWSAFNENRKIAEEEYLQGMKHGSSRKYYDTGELMEQTDWLEDKKDGAYKVFYKGGEPYIKCKMKNDMRNGLFLIYYDNGQQELIGEYKDNLRHGEWKYFNEEGEYLYSLHYNSGQILNPAVRDSIDNLHMQALEKNKGAILDPEKFMQDPSEYLMKNRENR